MYCTKCGSPNQDTDQYCRNCAAPLVNPRATSRIPPRSTNPPYATPPQPSAPPPYPGYSGYPPPQFGVGNKMMGLENKASGQAIAAMILSILSLVSCCFPLSIVGLILGKIEMTAIREGRSSRAGEAFAKAGYYIGLLSIGLTVLAMFFGFFGRLID